MIKQIKPGVSIVEAAEMLRTTERTLRSWVDRCKRGDVRYKGLPYHQIGERHPITFDPERLERWWNMHTNTGVGLQ